MSKIIENPKRQTLRNNEYYDFQVVQDQLYADSSKGKIFTNLMSKIVDRNNVLLAYRNIKKNTGSNTKGTDGKTIAYLARMESDDLVKFVEAKLRNYQPQAVRRVEIPKPDGKMRPLGIPTISDRLVQQCILQVLEPICEAKFYKHSYGFRPLRGTKHAIARAYHLAQKANLHYVVDVDIKGFFDNIDHGKLLKQLWTLGIQDKSLLAILSKLLKAEIEGIGTPEKGTPQGGIISPLLANVALNEFDHWIASQWEGMQMKHDYTQIRNGIMDISHKIRALKQSNLKEVYIVRYADDFKLFCRNHNHAKRIFEATKLWLKERLELEVSPEKSKIVNLRKNYSDFLGIKLKVTTKGKVKNKNDNKWVVKSHIGLKAFKKILLTMKEHAKAVQKPKDSGKSAVMRLNSYIIGVHNYYNCATNCNLDFSAIAYRTRSILKNRLKPRKAKEKEPIPKYIKDMYGKSKQLRFVYDTPLIPIGYIQHQITSYQFKGYSIYKQADREQIHTEQKAVPIENLKYLVANPVRGQSAEYNDNRISLYVGQYGKCYVLGNTLDVDEIHCHHKKPRALNGKDEYKNLVIVHANVHRLIHATDSETINRYTNLLELNAEQLERVNKLRVLAGNQLIA